MVTLLTILALLQASTSPARSTPADAVDSLITIEMSRQHIPGVALAILRDGARPEFRSYGLADLEHRVPVTEHSVFKIGSVSKQFIAATIVHLAQGGRLRLDDSVARFFDGPSPSWRGLLIRHLLTHTGGFPREVPGWNSFTAFAPDSLARMIERIEPQTRPGHAYAYSNAGYFALARVIERVTGREWSQFVRDSLLAPAGLRETYPADYRLVVPNRVSGYNWERDHWENDGLVVSVRPSGGLEASVADLARWMTLFPADSFLAPGTYEMMTRPTVLEDGVAYPYGLGWDATQWRGRPLVSHGGELLGFSAMIARFPNDNLTVIVLVNSSSASAERIALAVSATVLPEAGVRTWSVQRDPDPALTGLLQQGLVNVGNGAPFGDPASESLEAALRGLPQVSRSALAERMRSIDSFAFLKAEPIVHAPVLRLEGLVAEVRYYRLTRGPDTYHYAFYFAPDRRLVALESLAR